MQQDSTITLILMTLTLLLMTFVILTTMLQLVSPSGGLFSPREI